MSKKEIHFRTIARPDGKYHLQFKVGIFFKSWETENNPCKIVNIDHQPNSEGSIFPSVDECIKYIYFQENAKPEKLILIEHSPLKIHATHERV